MTVKTRQRTLTDDWELLKHRRFLEEQVRPGRRGRSREWKRVTDGRARGRTQAPHPRCESRGARVPLRVPSVCLREGRAFPVTHSSPQPPSSLLGGRCPSTSRSRATRCDHRAGARPAPPRPPHAPGCAFSVADGSSLPSAPLCQPCWLPRILVSTPPPSSLSAPRYVHSLGLRPPRLRPPPPVMSGCRRQTGHHTAAPSPSPSRPARLLGRHTPPRRAAGRLLL